MKEYINSLQWRYSTKKYDATKKVSEQDIDTLKEAISLSVSSVGLQPYKVIIVENPEIREKLKAGATGNNITLFGDASHIIIFANEVNLGQKQIDAYMDNVATTRNLPKEAIKGFSDYVSEYVSGLSEEQKNTWTAKQAYIALSTLINTAALLKIDATPMEGFDAPTINEILGLDKLGLNATVIATIGYRHADDAMQHLKKVRKPNEELFITI